MSTEVEVSEFAVPWCDFCPGRTAKAEYDAKTILGPWACLCNAHFLELGLGLGTGLGQRLVVRRSK